MDAGPQFKQPALFPMRKQAAPKPPKPEPITGYESPTAGQTVMSIHQGELHATPPWREWPGTAERNRPAPLTLDQHGNAYDERTPSYVHHAPQLNANAAEIFAQHGSVVPLHPHTPLHTMQEALWTGSLKGIRGAHMREGTEVPVLMHEGTPYLMDGHHRRAAAAARGEVINARVVNSDQFDVVKHPRSYARPSGLQGLLGRLAGDA